MSNKVWAVECEAKGIDAEFYLNDIPLSYRGGPGGGPYAALPVSEIIRDGRNELAVVIGAGPEADASTNPDWRRRRTLAGAASIRLTLASYPKGAVAGGPDAKVAAEITWSADAGRSLHLPLVLSATAEASNAGGAWAWEDCPPHDVDELLPGNCHRFLLEMQQSFEAGIWEHFTEVAEPRLTAIDRAYGQPPGTRADTAADMLQMSIGDQEVSFEDLDSQTPAYRICAEGRMVQCIDQLRQPLLRLQPDEHGAVTEFEFFLSNDEGSLVAVR